ncbi:MAG: hypothetical protein ACR2NR_19730 [Solirubrobacteraceae bacterium]
MAMSRYPAQDRGWVQTVNKLKHNAFWRRDATMIASAFDLAGLHAEAAQDIRFFASWQLGKRPVRLPQPASGERGRELDLARLADARH